MSNTDSECCKCCNWCGESVALMPGKPYCKQCLDASVQVCVRCKRPFNSYKYFTKDPLQARCDSCTNKLAKEQLKRDKHRCNPLVIDTDSSSSTGNNSDNELNFKGKIDKHSSEDETSLHEVVKKKRSVSGKIPPTQRKKRTPLTEDEGHKVKKVRKSANPRKKPSQNLLQISKLGKTILGFIPIYAGPSHAETEN